MRLPLGAGWYPLVGWTLSATYLTADVPARYHLEVTGADNLTFVSNLPAIDDHTFELAGATWALLFGSPHLAVEHVEETTLVTARDLMPPLRERFAGQFAPGMEYLSRFFPDTPVYPLLILSVDNPFAGLPGWDMATAEQRVMLLDSGNLLQETLRRREFDFRTLIESLGGIELWPVLDAFGPFLWSHYQHQGELGPMRAELAGQSPAIDVLLDLYAENGDAGIIRLLVQARNDFDALQEYFRSPDQIAAWMREAIREH